MLRHLLLATAIAAAMAHGARDASSSTSQQHGAFSQREKKALSPA